METGKVEDLDTEVFQKLNSSENLSETETLIALAEPLDYLPMSAGPEGVVYDFETGRVSSIFQTRLYKRTSRCICVIYTEVGGPIKAWCTSGGK